MDNSIFMVERQTEREGETKTKTSQSAVEGVRERISYILYGCMACQLKNLWPIGKCRLDGRTSGRQKGLWDRARQGRFAEEDA